MKEIKKIPTLEPFFVYSKKKSLFSAQILSKIKATEKKLMEQIRKWTLVSCQGQNWITYGRVKVLTKNCLLPEDCEINLKSEVSRVGRGNYRNYNIRTFKDKIKDNWVNIIYCEEICMTLKPQGREILPSDLCEDQQTAKNWDDSKRNCNDSYMA